MDVIKIFKSTEIYSGYKAIKNKTKQRRKAYNKLSGIDFIL